MVTISPLIDLEFTAREASKAVDRRDLIIVIDVLRSCSTITSLLAEGAKSVVPTRTLREAYRFRRQHRDYLLFGERKGRKPRRFDFGNSPSGFTSRDVRQKNIVMTTTSGTLAITLCRPARWVLIGSLLNAGAVAREALRTSRDNGVNISFVLSGDRGQFSLEDFICAGAIAEGFQENAFSDKVSAAVFGFERARRNLLKNIKKAQHAKHLIDMGLEEDIAASCQLNSRNIVPVYKNGTIIEMREGGPAGIRSQTGSSPPPGRHQVF